MSMGWLRLSSRPSCLVSLALLAAGLMLIGPRWASAQIGGYTRQVGGVWIDGNGLMRNREPDETGRLRAERAKAMQPCPDGAKDLCKLRKVSLARLDAALAAQLKTGKKLSDEMLFLAGLQRIQYVFVYPDEHDVVLVGPGEGWELSEQGEVVGITTHRPVMLLDDLLVALRAINLDQTMPISCSIDPTDEGLVQLKSLVKQLHTIGDPQETSVAIEQSLGPQKITVTGIPADTHFARVIVAADYRMKRIAMDFEPSPVKGMPSFLHLMKASGKGMRSMLPRWWLEPNYDAMLADPDGLAWELRGASVKAMTEDDFMTESGARKQTGKVCLAAKKWADSMTAHYDELATKDPVFGQLRNCIDLAVVAALVMQEGLCQRAGCKLAVLNDPAALAAEQYNLPRQVDSQVSLLQKGSNWLISASGGVKIEPWAMLQNPERSADLAPARKQALPAGDRWWWN